MKTPAPNATTHTQQGTIISSPKWRLGLRRRRARWVPALLCSQSSSGPRPPVACLILGRRVAFCDTAAEQAAFERRRSRFCMRSRHVVTARRPSSPGCRFWYFSAAR